MSPIHTHHFKFHDNLGNFQIEWTEKAEISKAEYLELGEACKTKAEYLELGEACKTKAEYLELEEACKTKVEN